MMHEKVEQFIEFCASQKPSREYIWSDSHVCALGQFNGYNRDGWGEDFDACNEIAAILPRDFGSLTKRLRVNLGRAALMADC